MNFQGKRQENGFGSLFRSHVLGRWNIMRWTILILNLLASCLLSQKVEAEFVLQTICEFPATNALNTNAPPQQPSGGLLEASDGSFYGTAGGGSNYTGLGSGNGTIFRLTKDGAMTRIFSFNGTNGNIPSGGLVLGNDGFMYGTTRNGGSNYAGADDFFTGANGTIFKIATNGALTSLFLFKGTNGNWPVGRLALGNDGNFYGTTFYGGNGFTGAQSGNGTVFKYSTNGVFNVLCYFNGTNGSRLLSGLTLGNDGNFYGTTEFGGSNYITGNGNSGNGTVFQITTNGVLTTLAYFNGTNGSLPLAGLIQGPDNNFYGTTRGGGIGYTTGNIFSGNGTVYQITTNGILTTLLFCNDTNGGNPSSGLTLGADGNLYGSTPWIVTNDATHFGTLFRITTNKSLTTLVYLNGTNGIHPRTEMILGSDGNLYGSMVDVMASQLPDGSMGSIFRLVQPPVLDSATLTNGGIRISWSSFTNATYNIEYKTNLVAVNWTSLVTNIGATSNSALFIDSSLDSIQRFYRVRLLP